MTQLFLPSRRRWSTFRSIAAMAIGCCLLTACPLSTSVGTPSQSVPRTSLTPSLLFLGVGQSGKVEISINPSSPYEYEIVAPDRPPTVTSPRSTPIQTEVLKRSDKQTDILFDVDPAADPGLYRFKIDSSSTFEGTVGEVQVLVLPTDAKAPAGRVLEVASSAMHSLALLEDGSVWSWGRNDAGQLGDGSFTDRPIPVRVAGLSGRVSAIAAGGSHSLALMADGSVWAWGSNKYNQVMTGIARGDAYLLPVRCRLVSRLFSATAIAAGEDHSVLLTAGKRIEVWGSNGYGQYGTRPERSVMGDGHREFDLLVNATAIVAAGDHTMALGDDNTVFGWGRTDRGQLGAGYSQAYTNGPSEIPWLPPVHGIFAGGDHSLFLFDNGVLGAIGANTTSQLGDGSLKTPIRPVSPPHLINVTSAAGGWLHSLALQGDGTVHAWGENSAGQASASANLTPNKNGHIVQPVPQEVTGLPRSHRIAAGGRHSLSLNDSDRGVFAWGDNSVGQLGSGALHEGRHEPAPVYGFGDPNSRTVLAAFGSGPGRVTVTSTAGIAIDDADCSTPRVAVFDRGTYVTLTAREVDGSHFLGWSGNCSGTSATIPVLMSRSRNCLARFGVAPKPWFSMSREAVTAVNPVAVDFDASVSNDTDGYVVRYQWDFNEDGIFDAEGLKASFDPTVIGTANIRLRVTDNDGLTADYTRQLEVTSTSGSGASLVAAFTHDPEEPGVGMTAHFDASRSRGGQTIVSYEWDFESDGIVDATGVTAEHVFSATGTYLVTLQVTDQKGTKISASDSIVVSEG